MKEEIFKEIKAVMQAHQENLKVTFDSPTRYDLYTDKPAEINGKLREGMYFASVIIQKHFVGFYFMPVYTNTEIKEHFDTKLLKMLKGKSCFHITKDDPEIYALIEDSLKKGIECYTVRGWM